MKKTRLVALAIIAALALTLSPPALAHDFEPERELIVQVFPTHLDVVILYTEAPGPRTDLFVAQFSLGTGLTGPFKEFAARGILPRMLDGLQFEVAGESPRTGEPEVKIEHRQGRLTAAAFVRYELDELDEGARRTVVVRAQDRSFLMTPTVIYAGEGLTMVEPDALERTLLRRGMEIEATFERR